MRQSSPLANPQKTNETETLFRAKLGRLAQLTQKTLYERAKFSPDPDYQERLLKCHAEISGSVQVILG